MSLISIQFGAGGISVEREFEVVPRVGDIIHVIRDDEEFDLLIDLAQHSQDPDDHRMKYFLHAHVIDDLPAEMSRQMDRARR
ncbi:hypothetical protein E5A73_01500 [Sphingomonas gei]|uniref:Uncharacterized protein n=1 Tax=Sphingomonas gei TaxID=1395960 RepID=A0A4S1XI15_9SPHN|nr:hypothetical protein [Sphingomonas gei]TGX55831.1 hypothetical protein E5A73_01500 [Sphingomonas gei]